MGNYWYKGSWVAVMEGEMLEAITLWRLLPSRMIWGKQLYTAFAWDWAQG